MNEDELTRAFIIMLCFGVALWIAVSIVVVSFDAQYEACRQVSDISKWNNTLDMCQGYRLYLQR